ncbi:hypothetical protein [Frateuria defendens]|uniref:hypothetical protein n=1 Tax=Frateuria defendens TaxID=2219559 RepID=UPI00066FD399|nr:hypothetical protein [Frateuria defendens]
MSTVVELQLSAAYRQAQRKLGHWIAQSGAISRQQAFQARAALAPLDATEHDRLVRWLAWLCVAARSRGDARLPSRLRRLDATLQQAVERALARLPEPARAAPPTLHRLSA